eukprot:6478163-Amphidinium_carterae.1
MGKGPGPCRTLYTRTHNSASSHTSINNVPAGVGPDEAAKQNMHTTLQPRAIQGYIEVLCHNERLSSLSSCVLCLSSITVKSSTAVRSTKVLLP